MLFVAHVKGETCTIHRMLFAELNKIYCRVISSQINKLFVKALRAEHDGISIQIAKLFFYLMDLVLPDDVRKKSNEKVHLQEQVRQQKEYQLYYIHAFAALIFFLFKFYQNWMLLLCCFLFLKLSQRFHP